MGESGLEDSVESFSVGGEGDAFKAAVIFASFLTGGSFTEIDFGSGGVTGKIVFKGDEPSHERAVGFKLQDGGHILFAEEEIAIEHEGESFWVETAAAVFHSRFGIGRVGDETSERFAVGIFVKVGGKMGWDGRGDIFFVRCEGYGVEAGREVDVAVAGTAVGGEVEGFSRGVIGGTRAEATCGVVERVEGGGRDGAEGFELGLGKEGGGK